MALEVQPKLLKALEEKRFRRLGDVHDRRADIRLIVATHYDLGLLVREKKFRSDLYFRISAIPLFVPPLRQRADDIPLLARYLLERLAADLGRRGVELAPDGEQALREYPWPGNIRELRNVLDRALLLSNRNILGRRDLLFDVSVRGESLGPISNLTLRELERRHIETVLREEHGNVDQAARRLGIPRSSLYARIKKWE
jgi:DNA-binding NtrC family response regulator